MWVNHEGNAKIYDGSAADLLLFDRGREVESRSDSQVPPISPIPRLMRAAVYLSYSNLPADADDGDAVAGAGAGFSGLRKGVTGQPKVSPEKDKMPLRRELGHR